MMIAGARPQRSARAGRLGILALGTVLGCLALAWIVYQALRGAGFGVPDSGPAEPAQAPASPGHRLVWNDEFGGPTGSRPDPAKWGIVSGNRAGQLQSYTRRPGNVSLDGAGHLAVTARREKSTDSRGVTRPFTSASLETKGLFETKYGRLEARAKIPRGQGLWSGFWAIGSDFDGVGWPRSGEIDMMENLGKNPFTISGSIHGPQDRARDGYAITKAKRSSVSLTSEFHVYGVRWSRREIVFSFDDVPYTRLNQQRSPRDSSGCSTNRSS
jgi:beta-glucanase (GH16 family)